jgi:hypothetical protein
MNRADDTALAPRSGRTTIGACIGGSAGRGLTGARGRGTPSPRPSPRGRGGRWFVCHVPIREGDLSVEREALCATLLKNRGRSYGQRPSSQGAMGSHLRIGESITVVVRKGTVPFSSSENRDSPPLIHSPVLMHLAPRRKAGRASQPCCKSLLQNSPLRPKPAKNRPENSTGRTRVIYPIGTGEEITAPLGRGQSHFRRPPLRGGARKIGTVPHLFLRRS